MEDAKESIIDHYKKVINDNFNPHAKKMAEDVELLESKLKGKKLDLSNIIIKSLSYIDILAGFEGISALPDFVEKIFSITQEELSKNQEIVWTAIKNRPTVLKRTFVTDWDHCLVFLPEYHYQNGSKIYENKSLEELGYTNTNLMQILDHIKTSLSIYHKFSTMIDQLKHQFDLCEQFAVSQINRGVKEKDYTHGLFVLNHGVIPLWFYSMSGSLKTYSSHALTVVKEVSFKH